LSHVEDGPSNPSRPVDDSNLRSLRSEQSDVAAAVSAYLAVAPADFEGLTVVRADTADGRSSRVTLSSYWRPPLVSLLVPEGLRIEVTALGRSVFT